MDAVAEAEVYFGFGIPRELFIAAPNLRWVHSAAAGVGTALHEEMRASDVLLTNSAGIHAVPIAEYIVAGVLHFLRGLDFAGEVESAQKVQHAGDDVLGDRHGMDAGGIGEQHVARAHLLVQRRADAGRGRVDPAEVRSGDEELARDSESEVDLRLSHGVHDFIARTRWTVAIGARRRRDDVDAPAGR